MSGNGAGGDQVPLIEFPAKLVHQRSKRQSSVGEAAADHDLSASVKCLNQAGGTQINICCLYFVANVGKRFTRFHVRDRNAAFRKFLKPAENIVASYDADLYLAAESDLTR